MLISYLYKQYTTCVIQTSFDLYQIITRILINRHICHKSTALVW
jgi:hypothetical protein